MIGYYPNSMNETLFRPQDRFRQLKGRKNRKKEFESTDLFQEARTDFVSQEEEFSRSVDVSETRVRSVSANSETSSFVQSVVVVPHSDLDGKYSIYPGVHDNLSRVPKGAAESDVARSSFLSSLKYEHNISNPELRLTRYEHDRWELAMRKRSLFDKLKRSDPKTKLTSSASSDPGRPRHNKCQCGQYHSHVFKLPHTRMSKLTLARPEEHPAQNKSTDVSHSNINQTIISTIFWKASLSFCEYKHEKDMVDFKTLWPSMSTVRSLLRDGIEETGLEGALWELCSLLMADGPVSVIQELLDMKYIRIDCQFENDAGLLHLACVLQNMDAVQLITQSGVSAKIKDKSGKTAGEVCFCPKVRKNLPTKLQSSFLADRGKNHTALKPGLHDKDSIFKLASNAKCLYELQKKLQTFDFNVNDETKAGDYLVHVAAKAGICQLPLLMSLVRIQQADINLCNGDGMTPLMIVALDGDSNFCDTMMCLFGADPNKQNNKNGRTALHYAVMNNQVNVVNCLVKRGADINIEEKDRCRPDDMVLPGNATDDCRQIIQLHRVQRCHDLSEKIREDAVYPIDLRLTDLSVIDSSDSTLIMVAAAHNRVHNLEILLSVSPATVDAQHRKTGLTALAIAAKAGHKDCCSILLKHGACASIQDIEGYLALHHAVLQNHENVVEVFRDHFPAAYVGLFKSLRLCRKSSIHDKLTVMFEERQDNMVTPQLRMSALDGDAEKLYCLLEEGDNVNSKSDLNTKSALFDAVENCHVDVVRLLVERSADLRKRDILTANTVLHITSQTGSLETAKYLLQFCKSQPESKSGSVNRLDINAVNNDKKTALQIASEKGYIKLIKLLIDCGATTALLNHQGTLFTSAEFEGARVLIEGHRIEHTQAVMKLVMDRSKRSHLLLAKIWVPRFDHNLRDKNGDTPLMVACRFGRLDTVKFLLQSAVYANQISDDDSDHSDADSGVPDLPVWKSYAVNQEELWKSMEKSLDYEQLPVGASFEITRALNPSDLLNSLPGPVVTERGSNRVTALLTDIQRPKGRFIYHDGIVSHVCAVNLFDGNTPLHRTIEGGDCADIATVLIAADSAVINVQNDSGLTPVHLACKLGRKKIMEKLLMIAGVDLSLFTLNGHLPEEMTSNKSLIKMIQKARRNQPVRLEPEHTDNDQFVNAKMMTESLPSSLVSRGGGSTINFDKITDMYSTLRLSTRDEACGDVA